MSFNLGKVTADTIPRGLTTLSVSWLNNQFKAVSVHRGRVQKTWEFPGACDSLDKVDEIIREAVHETGYQGQTVSLVLTHPRLVQQMVDVPPVKGAALNKVIQRQASQQKYFPGEAAYASQMLVSSKGSPRVVLHLFPRVLLNQFMLGCRRNNLHLVSVMPASAALQRQLRSLSLQKTDVVMVAAETSGSTTAVVCDGDGRLLMARTLQGSWQDDAAKLAVDLNRTILFVSQHFGVNLSKGLYLYGARAAEQAPVIQRQVQVPVRVSPVPSDPFYWAVESLKVRQETAPNFQSPELQKAPQRRVFAQVVAASATLLLAGSVALTAYSIRQSRKEQSIIKNFTLQMAHMERRQQHLEQLDAEMQRKQQAIDLVLGNRPPPKPAWMLAYLGQIAPAELVITNFSIEREASFYRVKIGGTRQEAALSPTATSMVDAIAAFKSTLADKPFHLRILDTDAAEKPAPTTKTAQTSSGRVSLAPWINEMINRRKHKPQPQAPKPEQTQTDHFVIEGVIR